MYTIGLTNVPTRPRVTEEDSPNEPCAALPHCAETVSSAVHARRSRMLTMRQQRRRARRGDGETGSDDGKGRGRCAVAAECTWTESRPFLPSRVSPRGGGRMVVR